MIVRDGKIFATQRGYGEFKDWWEFPGGKIEAGESPEQALVREIREELDAGIDICGLLDTIEWDYPSFHLTMYCFSATLKSDALHLNEHEAAAWLGREDLDSVKWLPADRGLIEKLKNTDFQTLDMETVYKQEFVKRKLVSPADGLVISVMSCTPAGEPRGVVQFVHGMCEHKERYMPVMEYLSSRGYACIIHDHRGHGESVRSSDDLGYFYEGGYQAMIEDIGAVNRIAREEFPGKPLALFGHSMGSMAVRSYSKRYDDTIDALVICGSPSYNRGAGTARFLARIFAFFVGDRHRPELIQKLAFGSFNRNFGHVSSPHAWVCSDPEIVDRYDRDPLCNFQFTADGFINLFSLMQDAYDTADWHLHRPDLPVLFISGEEDPCLMNRVKFDGAVENMRKAGYRNVSSRLYPGMRHEILNETGKEQVWSDIADFLASSFSHHFHPAG